MEDKIITILKEATEGRLTDESIQAIQEAVDAKTQLNVQAALTKQDEQYAEKLKTLLEAIDKDHATKTRRLIEAVDKNNVTKLKKVVNKYKKALASEATSFKGQLVRSISKYLNVYIEDAIPQELIEQAVLERKAQGVLENLRQHLAIDSALMKEAVRGGIEDGKNQINEARQELEKTQQRTKLLEKKLERAQADLILTEKTASLPAKKRDYVKRVLADKSSNFIAENIDYTINLFDKSEQEQLGVLKEQAFKDAVGIDDVPTGEEEVIAESAKQFEGAFIPHYLTELSKY